MTTGGRERKDERTSGSHCAGEAPRRATAALLGAAVLAGALGSGGCTIGQTRFALGATVVADAATTQTALNRGGASEANPVLKSAPVPIMLLLSGVVALVAEKHVRQGDTGKAKTLYTIASVVHGAAAAWNGYQLGQSGGSSPARPATALAAPTGAPGTRDGAFRVRF